MWKLEVSLSLPVVFIFVAKRVPLLDFVRILEACKRGGLFEQWND